MLITLKPYQVKLFVLSVLLLLVGFIWQFTSSSNTKNLKVIFLNVEQGDATLIQTPKEKTILIDGGPNAAILEKLGQYLPFHQKKIDLIILTHPHSDHVTGLISVLQNYQINLILMNGVNHTTPEYITFLKLIKNKKIPVNIVENASFIDLEDNIRMEILYPDRNLANLDVKDLNDGSIVTYLIAKNIKFLFMGDAGFGVENRLMASNLLLQTNVLKIGHHGSRESSSSEFLNYVRPEFAIISSGANNLFGHPSKELLKRLNNQNIKTYRTDKHGDIIFTTNGINLQLQLGSPTSK